MTSTKPLSQLPFAVDNKFKLYLRGVLLLPQKKKRVFRPLFLLLRLAFNFILYLFHHGAMYGTAFETLKASSKNDVSTRNNQEPGTNTNGAVPYTRRRSKLTSEEYFPVGLSVIGNRDREKKRKEKKKESPRYAELARLRSTALDVLYTVCSLRPLRSLR